MGLLDTWREVRQQIIDSKPTYEPFITPKEYVSPFYADTPEAEVAAAPVAAAPVYDQGLLYKRRLPPLNEDPITDFAMWQTPPSPYKPVETTKQLEDLMGITPTVNVLSALLPGGILMNAAHRHQIQNAANRIFGANLEGGEFGFGDIIPFFGGDYEKRIRDTMQNAYAVNPSMPAYPVSVNEQTGFPLEDQSPPPQLQPSGPQGYQYMPDPGFRGYTIENTPNPQGILPSHDWTDVSPADDLTDWSNPDADYSYTGGWF